MWTPKRILMLAFGLVLFVTGYLVYGRFLGGIDGLPPLPPQYCPPKNGVSNSIDSGPSRPHTFTRLEEKLTNAFGPGCEELKRPIKLELNSKSTLLAADTCVIENGKLRLEPLSVAMIGKPKKDSRGKDFREINIIRCRQAILTCDRPLEKSTDVNGRKIVAAELSGDIRVLNKKHAVQSDDNVEFSDKEIEVFINKGPVFYEEAKHLVWTSDDILLVDGSTAPPTKVRGKGMEMELAVETPPPPPAAPAGYKPKGETITGVKRIVLQSDVEMYLYADGHAGFPGGQSSTATPAKGPQPARPQAAPAEKSLVTIKSPGRFQYDLSKDFDLAHFDAAVTAATVLGQASSPRNVVVTRHNERLNLVDQLICDHLDLKLVQNAPTPGKPASGPGENADRSREIDTAHATGKTVVITSDAEKLTAECVDLFYDAKAKLTVLKGNPQDPNNSNIKATKEGNNLEARELRLQDQVGPDGKTYQQGTAVGPGHLDLVEKSGITPDDKKTPAKSGDKLAGPQKPTKAYWNDTLVSTKDGVYDLFILSGSARFVDEEHGQTLQGDTLKVWLGAVEKPAGGPATAAQPGSTTENRRPHHLEAHGNVEASASQMKIHDTSHLVVWFRDEEIPKSLPGPVAEKVPTATTPAPQTGPAYQAQKAPTPVAAPPSAPVASATPSPAPAAAKTEEAPPRPVDISARSIEAHVLRGETKNILETVRCEGAVKVHQDPAKGDEKGVDIVGDKLAMDYHEEGNTLVVMSDGDDPASLQMDKMSIFGLDIHIDQAENKAWVNGPGAMTMVSQTSFSGEPLKKPAVPLTIHWSKSMFFGGNYSEFYGSNQAEQENARLACDKLVVYFDRRVSLKEGNKSDKPAKVHHLMCDTAARVEDTTYEGKELVKYQQLVAPSIRFSTLTAEVEPKANGEPVSDGNEVYTRGPGEVRALGKGGPDPLAPPPPAGQQGTATVAKPAAGGKPEDDQMKMTYVSYGSSMYANSKKNYTKFLGNVRVLNFPCTDPHIDINLDLMLTQLPEGAMYIRSDVLEVWTNQAKDRKYSEMHASGGALVQANEFWGRAATIHFDESKDQIIFDGGTRNALLFKVTAKGKEPDRIEAKKIIYIRSTGQFWIDRGTSISGMGAASSMPK